MKDVYKNFELYIGCDDSEIANKISAKLAEEITKDSSSIIVTFTNGIHISVNADEKIFGNHLKKIIEEVCEDEIEKLDDDGILNIKTFINPISQEIFNVLMKGN